MSDYSSTYPTQRPTFAFDAKAGKLDSRLSYSRSSSGTAFSSERHLSSENLITQSQFSGWAKLTSPTVTAAYTNGPDGSINTATRLQSASGADRYFYSTQTSWTSGQQYTVSCWVKSNTGVAQTFAFFIPSTAYVTADLTTHASDWTRITATVTAAVSSSYCGFKLSSANTTDLSIWGFQVNSGANALDYQATSGSIHRSFAPTLKSHSSDQPRFEYSATDGQSEGLLIEAQATSLVTYSEDFSNAFWTKTRLSVDSNVAVAPDGSLTASALRVDGTAAASHRIRFLYNPSGATPQTFSIFAKAASVNYLAVKFDTSGGTFGGEIVYFNLSNGTAENASSGITTSVKNCGNGWYRVSATLTANASGNNGQIELFVTDTSTTVNIDGNSYDHILAWGAMVEANTSAPSSYIKSNSGSSTSRASDSCSVVDATLFSSGEHTIIWEGDTDPTTIDKRFFALSDGSFDNRFVADYDNGTATRIRNWADGDTNVSINTSAVNMTVGTHKLAGTLKTNECQLVVDGARRQVDTSCVVGGGIDQLAINSSTTGAGTVYNMNGHCKRITYYNVALSQTEAEALTSNP